MCQGKVTGDMGGKRLWNESAGYFIYHIHSVRQCGAVYQCPWFLVVVFLGVGVEEVVRERKWDTAGTSSGHGAPLPAEPNSVCARNGFMT